MTKQASKEPQKRIQVRVSVELANRVESMAKSMGISESALGAVLIRVGMTYMDTMLNPDRVQADAAELPRGVQSVEVEDRPGFRPGGKPRAELATVDDQHELVEQPRGTHGEQWTGYMRGL